VSTEFITARYPEQEMVRQTDRQTMLRRTRTFLDPADLARLRVAGVSKYGRWRSTDAIYGLVKERTARPDVGPKIIIQRKVGDLDEFSIREVMDKPDILDLNAHPGIEKSHTLTWAKFKGQLRSGGIWYCRRIDGSTQISKHGYLRRGEWQGAAEDTFVTEGGMTLLTKVANWKIEQTKSGLLSLSTVICDDWIWTPSQGKHNYSGARHYHIHEDCDGGVPCNP
jgi:hypothetical protein